MSISILIKFCLQQLQININSGSILIDGQKVNDLPPKERNIAMVFQSYALYPHMSVYENMAFGLKLEKKPKNEINDRVLEAAKILRIEELLENSLVIRSLKKEKFRFVM